MDEATVWEAIDRQRGRVADLLGSLPSAEWGAPSLCHGWRVRDVAAHLTLQQLTLPQALALALRSPGGVNHVIERSAIRKADRVSPDGLVAEIRSTVGSRRTNVGITPGGALSDVVLHGQDIALPLGRRIVVEPETAAAVVRTVWGLLGTRPARVYAESPRKGIRFVASDVDWAEGEGPAAHAPALALALILSGRPLALSQAAGPGAELMRRRLRGTA